jgi:dipeptidyl-peptidase-4
MNHLRKPVQAIVCGLFVSLSVLAQQQLTIDDAVLGRYKKFARTYWYSTIAVPQSDKFAYLKNADSLMVVQAPSGKNSLLLDVNQVNKLLDAQKADDIASFDDFKYLSANVVCVISEQRYVYIQVKPLKVLHVIQLPAAAENIEVAPVGMAVAFTLNNNVYYTTGVEAKAITNNENKGIVSGQTVSRNEFGIEKGIFWSPDGKSIAFYQKDEQQVKQYPVVHIEEVPAFADMIRYPMAGGPSETVSIGVFSLQTATTSFIGSGDTTNRYLTSVTWSPDSRYIFAGELNREQNHLKLNRYNAESGKYEKTLFEESNQRYVEPENPLYFLKGSSDFLWLSERNGHKHLYRYSIDGKLVGQVSSGNYEILSIIGFDVAKQNVYANTTALSPLDETPVVINLKSNKMQLLDQAPGIHQDILSESGKYMLDVFEAPDVPRRISICDAGGKQTAKLVDVPDPLKDYTLGNTQMLTLTSADGQTPLYARMVTPSVLEPGRKYPVIVYVYGGPHAQLVTHAWLNDAPLWDHYMASKGYIVFTLDNRGSMNRGFDFESVIHRNLGVCEMADQMQGIKFLKSLPYVDTTRFGVHGWSFGGFMTISLMLDHNETFKVGVAGGPVTDWNMYEVMYGERYMDMPRENPEGYQSTSVIKKVDKLRGRLLVIHGGEDPTVVLQQSLRFIEAGIKSKKQIDYFIYPTHEHNVRGVDRVNLMEKVTRYFDDNL